MIPTKSYPRLTQLGIKLRDAHGTLHVFSEDIVEALERNDMSVKQFHDMFENTKCIAVGNRVGLYPDQVENVLERMIAGKYG